MHPLSYKAEEDKCSLALKSAAWSCSDLKCVNYSWRNFGCNSPENSGCWLKSVHPSMVCEQIFRFEFASLSLLNFYRRIFGLWSGSPLISEWYSSKCRRASMMECFSKQLLHIKMVILNALFHDELQTGSQTEWELNILCTQAAVVWPPLSLQVT